MVSCRTGWDWIINCYSKYFPVQTLFIKCKLTFPVVSNCICHVVLSTMFYDILKGIVHPKKIEILSLITHPHVVPFLKDLRSSSEHESRYFWWNLRALLPTVCVCGVANVDPACAAPCLLADERTCMHRDTLVNGGRLSQKRRNHSIMKIIFV